MGAKGTFEPIYSFGHLHPTRKAEVIEFRTTNNNRKPLRMTSKHLIYEQRQGLFIPASNVKVGDILVSSDEEEVTVTSIRKVQASGLYAPFTPSGTIMVNHVLVSSFIDLQLSPTSSTTMQWLAHMGEFPHRVMCYYYSGYNYCQGETYNEVGINEIYIQPLKFIQEYLSSSSVVSTVFVTFLIPILFTFFSLVEQFLVFSTTSYSMTMMGLLLVLVVLRVGSSSSSWVLGMKKNK